MGSAFAAFPGTNGKLAFITNDPTTAHGRAIRTVNADGTGGQNIAPAYHASPDWSPDGKRIAFPDLNGGEVRIATADGTQVASLPVSYVSDIAWSPDGQRLALVRYRTAPPPPPTPNMEQPDEVWVVNADGAGLMQVTNTGNCVNDPEQDACTEIVTVSWSPDGAKLAYTRFDWYLDYENQFCPAPILYCALPQEVWFADPNVTGSDTKMPGGATATGVDWSPDGHKLLLSAPLRTVNPDGTGLTSLGADGYRAVWSPDGTKIAYQTYPEGEASPSSHISNIYTRNADGSNPQLLSANSFREHAPDWQPIPIGYPRPKGASPFYASFVPANTPCAAPNRTHGAPLSFGSCGPPSQTSPELTVGTPDANGRAANSIGAAWLTTRADNPATPSDEADVKVNTSITDVRKRSDLSDYTGELSLRLPVRITDRNNTGAGPATVSDAEIGITIPCAATADANMGATCATVTTVDATLPGAITGGKRSIWELGKLRVDDGGPDGIASTPGNSPFAVQGLFVP